MAVLCLGVWGCGVMRELPRGQYAAVPERRNVRVETRSGERHEFDRVVASSDSLTGYERREEEEISFEEFRTVRLSLDDIARMSVRSVDWYRTGLIGGLVLGVAVAIILTQSSSNGTSSGTPCPRCP